MQLRPIISLNAQLLDSVTSVRTAIVRSIHSVCIYTSTVSACYSVCYDCDRHLCSLFLHGNKRDRLETWNFNTMYRMVSIRVSTFCFEKLAQDKEITAVLLLQRDNPCDAVRRPPSDRGCRAGTLQWRSLHNAIACTVAGPWGANTWERSHLHNADRVSSRKKL